MTTTEEADALAERLRMLANFGTTTVDGKGRSETMLAAADRIEALEAEVAALREAPAKVFHGYIREDLSREACAQAYAEALEAAARAAFRACKATGAGYRDQNERLLQRAENEMRLETRKAIRALPNPYRSENET